MNKKKVIGLTKKLVAGILATGMIVAGIIIVPKNVKATYADTIYYDDSLVIGDYWKKDSKTAPVKEGYVFGGWYSAKEQDSYLTPEMIDRDSDGEIDYEGTAYAKFVPAQVLSVKAQNQANTNKDTAKTHVRIISSLDSTNYEKVGFDIWLANKTQLLKDDGTALETTKIYTGLKEGDNVKTVEEIFGGASEYLSVWQLNNVGKSNFRKIIYVRPYWITMDGTKVEGLAKYVHIEDDYKGYISVPVNLLSTDDVAAGAMDMVYDNPALELATDDEGNVLYEAGRILPEMAFSHDATNKTIKMVGNVATVNDYNSGECIYANIRFKKPSTDTNFTMNLVKFCDWTETVVANEKVKVWDIKYDVQETTNE